MANQGPQPNQQAMLPPPWYVFEPSDARVVHTFLIPKIRGLPLPLHDISEADVFADHPQAIAGANGYTQEKTNIYCFTQTTQMNTDLWKRVSNYPEAIISNNLVIGSKNKYYYAANRLSQVKWYLEEYTAEGENSTLAVYKLYPGKEDGEEDLDGQDGEDLDAALNINLGDI